MSDEIETKPEVEPVPAEATPAAAPVVKPTNAELIEARAKELRAYKGKFFRQKGNPNGPIIEIIDYAGVKSKTIASEGQLIKQEAHTFLAEMRGARWTPAATPFLEAHEEVPAPVKPIKSQLPI
jgi:hypothetical protein